MSSIQDELAHLQVSWLFSTAHTCSVNLFEMYGQFGLCIVVESLYIWVCILSLCWMYAFCACNCSWFLIVLVLWNADFMLDFLESFVMYLVSFPVCVCVCVCERERERVRVRVRVRARVCVNMFHFFLFPSPVYMVLLHIPGVCGVSCWFWICSALWLRGGDYYQLLFIIWYLTLDFVMDGTKSCILLHL
jgi:hypothetical protein